MGCQIFGVVTSNSKRNLIFRRRFFTAESAESAEESHLALDFDLYKSAIQLHICTKCDTMGLFTLVAYLLVSRFDKMEHSHDRKNPDS